METPRLVLRRELIRAGWSDQEVRRRQRAGELLRLGRGAYVQAPGRPTAVRGPARPARGGPRRAPCGRRRAEPRLGRGAPPALDVGAAARPHPPHP
ncbi:type IV toxin-antitoxin system AbiEi family antitoxin domain-containing protein [Pseudonocardia kunmingensis]|uniref:type IV toxin-antitoxin system AbiEi family antitoxin domain-containing protein n=1 Tax=Pseudonocardia kunmingensis TaxID=630975 RepID=UPI0011502500